MKKYLILSIVVFAFLTFDVCACEICGCSNGNFQIGLLPNFDNGFLGMRYSFSRFDSHVRDEPTEFSNDYYQTVELWGGYNFKKIQVMAFMPYVSSRKVSDDGTTISNDAGDLMMLVNYELFSQSSLSNNEKTTKHEIYLGAGVKLPTGANAVNVSDPEFNIGDFNSQAGTGSTDFILNATYNLLWGNNGVVTNVAYRMNTANKQDYRFGNRTYLNASYFYSFGKGNSKIIPNAGINWQSNAINTFEGTDVEDSNGYNLNSTVGLNFLYKKLGVNAIAFLPLTQNNFDGQTKLKARLQFGITYSF